ncbi:immunoglobulin superfamily member 10-like protein, partial [Lates japonicus]
MLPFRMLGLLMLIFLLCDADSTCPKDSNPLQLEPSEVIGEHGDEVMLDFGPSGPVTPVLSSTYNISVDYAPELKGNTTDFISVKEGDDVTLNCEAEGNPPPYFYWTRDGVNMTANTSNLSITQVMAHSVYTCTANNYLGTPTKHIYVDVIKSTMAGPTVDMTTPAAATRKGCPLTLMPPEIVVRFGDPASVNCTTSETDAQGMGWETPFAGTGFEKGPSVTWMVERLEDWHILAKCYITTNNGFQCQVMPSITLYKTPDLVSVTALDDGPMVEDTEYKLICDIINVAPVQNLTVKWYRDNETVTTERFNKSSVTPVNVTSTLRVTPTNKNDGARFKCDAELHLGPNGPKQIPATSSEPHIAVVNYKPLIEDLPDRYGGAENFTMDMVPFKAVGKPPPTVQWYYKGEPINASQPLNKNHSGTYTVEVKNSLGKSNKSVHIEIEYRPLFSCNKYYEVKEHSELQPECKLEGIPTPSIRWFKDGKPWAKQPWTRRDNGNYRLEATNRHGTVYQEFDVNVLYAPEFNETNYSHEVTLGQNVTFVCRAEGNPVPRSDSLANKLNMDWGTELWDQYDIIEKHTQSGLELVEKYVKFVKERTEIEQNYAKQLRNLSKKYNLKRSSKDEPECRLSSYQSFLDILNEMNDYAGQRELIAENMMMNICIDLTKYLQELKQERKTYLMDAKKAQQSLESTYKQLDSSKKRFEREWREAERAAQYAEKTDQDINATKADVEKAKQQAHMRAHVAEECKNDYAAQLQKYNKEQNQFYFTDMPLIFNKLQDLDERRVRKLAQGYILFSDTEKHVMPIIGKCLEGITKAGTNVNERN